MSTPFYVKFNQSILNVKNVPYWLIGAIMGTPLFLLAYWIYSFSGLYRFFTNFQVQNHGKYEDGAAFLFSLFCVMIPAASLLLFVAYNFFDKKVIRNEEPIFTLIDLVKDSINGKNGLMHKANIISRSHPFWILIYGGLFFIGLLMIGIGTITFISNYSISNTPVVVDIYNDALIKEGKTEYITIVGIPYCNYSSSLVESREKGSSSEIMSKEYYIPLFTPNGKFSFIFLGKATQGQEKFECVNNSVSSITGIISSRELPGIIRDKYLENGIIKESDQYSIIDLNSSDGPNTSGGKILLAGGTISLILLLLIEAKMRLFADKNFR
jgi:hypothetical protein